MDNFTQRLMPLNLTSPKVTFTGMIVILVGQAYNALCIGVISFGVVGGGILAWKVFS